ncbi:multidrug resistance-associated ABC transporter [Lentinus tigrinus ALCF2SS1-7]|uniref:Multidrug resistance-associated ABC transporter n=1 Tax=Lentinus tigrinus ALCF2SS1-6 TaxID=1328759 RepID=A0A5C2RWG4_9APHY|nr:multidrug resistance-associated ABC transporter [Lentinus tigrinus ALCF2SS1-6]RPD74135.1 multidrug resistance-associated ABC transporter [Lentinus tigrinus ALCF2SS1-7]
MPAYQLPVAISLTVAIVPSLVGRLASGTKEKKTALPTFAEGEEGLIRDPFDVTKPEDFIDGTPIDEDGFWTRMRLRKLTVSILLAAILVIQSVCLGWAITEDDRLNIAVYSLHIAFALYTLVLSALSINQTYSAHSQSIIHLCGLTFVATFLLGTTAILPSTPFPGTGTSILSIAGAPLTLWYTAVAMYAVCFLIVVTCPRGPCLHFPSESIYSEKTLMQITSKYEDNVCGITGASVWDVLLFSYTTKVVMLGNASESLEIGDLPIVAADMRATTLFASMRAAIRRWKLRIGSWHPQPGSGIELAYRLLRVNAWTMAMIIFLAIICAIMFYVPAFFLQRVVRYLEVDPGRESRGWGFVFCAGLFVSNAMTQLLTGQLWSFSTTTLQCRMRIQLNSILFAKTLVRKDIASASASEATDSENKDKEKNDDEDDFSSKAQIMTLMTTDVDRVSEFSWHLFTIFDAPIEILIGTLFLYSLLGVSCFFGLAVTCLFLPMNHFAGKVVVGAQDNLMKARDERVSLMNEILGGIRMLKFMAWERSFEARVHKIRERELKYQKLNYTIEVLWNAIWNGSPILVTLVAFWHYAVVRNQVLTPSIAFTSISVFNEMKFALNALPETLINMLQSAVSLRRIEKYLNGVEVAPVAPLDGQPHIIALQSATITWPQDRSRGSAAPSAASTPRHKFILMDLTLEFPLGELSLICGKLGSGKSLLLLALLGEADLLSGQLFCPRSPPDIIAQFAGVEVPQEEWVVEGVCAYVPQSAWLRNASIRDNILFDLPYVEERYQKTLEACALLSDLEILEDGDQSEIGERGVNLSGGQKARVSLARAVYSRASVLFLDDVLSAVDAHTAHHLYNQCLKGDLMRGRTLILVSHHVQLCAPGAKYIVSLDNGRVSYAGNYDNFQNSGVLKSLVQSGAADPSDDKEETKVEKVEEIMEETADKSGSAEPTEANSETSSTVALTASELDAKPEKKKAPRKLVEEEKRAVGRIGKDIWMAYLKACGSYGYWLTFACALGLAALAPVLENSWLRVWSGSYLKSGDPRPPSFYISVYAGITAFGLILTTLRWFVLYNGGIHASVVLYQKLLEGVLFANIRFHDTVSRGRLLNRFGKDFEGIDSSLPDNFGRSVINALSVATTFVTVSVVGGPPFIIAAVIFGSLYYSVGKVYGQTSRDMRRLDSVTRSPLYSIYGETIAGVAVLRAFGASSKFLRDMLRCADTNANPYYWMWGVNRWLSARFNLLSSAVIGITAFVAVVTPTIDASLAGFALAFASSLLSDLLFLVRRFVGLEQSMVAVERVKEFSELPREPPEFVEPRPPASWPTSGEIKCEDLVIRYAPELPNVLHHLSFEIRPGEKVGVLGRTGSGKSTLALSFFRFVEPTEGRILIDGLDISKIGLTDLRSKLTIIPQDPTILSGTLRSTLDVFNEYEDAEIYEALRRVHLIPAHDVSEEDEGVNANVFRNLDSPVSEGGENFSTGEKQLLCMARAILKRSRVLLMDEATASVDYATDELIGKTIRQEFASSTILTIAHRLRTVIDYDRVMLLDQGRIAEFDTPAALLSDPQSKFYALCKATGKQEFAVLKKMAGV